MAELESERLDLNQAISEVMNNEGYASSYLEDYLFKIKSDLETINAALEAIAAAGAVTGIRAGNPALASLLTVLGTQGLVDDQTTEGKSDPYNVTNLSVDREYDADSTSIAELADVLGTLIEDLKTAGILS